MLPKGSYAVDVLFWWGLALLLTIILLGKEDSEGATIKQHIKEFAIETACKEGVDPKLVLAIIKVESAGKTHVIGRAGEIGLMQLRPEFHPDAQFNYIKNVQAGVKYLKRIKNLRAARYPASWFVFYNVGPYKKLDNPKQVKYYRLITKEITREKINYTCASNN